MTITDIQNILKKITYPGFSRDIVSFGMVKNISIDSDSINIYLQINTDNKDILNQLSGTITKNIKSITEKNVNIQFQKPKQQSTASNNNDSLKQNHIPNVNNIIAVASGKGGVGKSTIAVNLATTLSTSFKVGLLDLDIYGPSLPLLTGLNEQPKITKDNKLIPLEKFNLKLMSFGFINNQNSPAVWRGPMVSRMTQQFFQDVIWGELDYLILDLPPGTGDIQLTLVQQLAITGAIIITTPQEIALLDVKKGADMFSKVNTPVLGVIENMTHFLCPHCSKSSQIFPGSGGKDESTRLDVPLLGQLYLNAEVSQSCDEGTPYVITHQESPITKEYNKIANQIIDLSS